MGISKPLDEWIEEFDPDAARASQKSGFIILTIVGKDAFTRSKVDDLNDAIGGRFLASWSRNNDGENEEAYVNAFYSADLGALVLVVNSFKDAGFISEFTPLNRESYFEAMDRMDTALESALVTVMSLSHIVLFVENSCRLELSLPILLQNVNQRRKAMASQIDSSVVPHGRIAAPRFLFAFHRNLIRPELGSQKRAELLEKLEQTLEDQTFDTFRHYRLVNRDDPFSNLGQIWGEGYVHLVDKVKSHTVDDLLAKLLTPDPSTDNSGDEEEDEATPALMLFLRKHIEKIRAYHSRNERLFFEVPTLERFSVIAQEIQRVSFNQPPVGRELEFIRQLTANQVEQAVRNYLPRDTGRVLSRPEHEQRVAAVIRGLDVVSVDPRNDWSEVRDKCESIWSSSLRGCEARSLSNVQCRLPAHPSVGEEGVERAKWQLHTSPHYCMSACSCGRNQMKRPDPFTLKAANFDFYEGFICCGERSTMEKYHFVVAGECGAADRSDFLAEEEEWPEARIVGQIGEKDRQEDEEALGDDSEDSTADENEQDRERGGSELQEDHRASYLDEDTSRDRSSFREPKDEALEKAIADLEERKRLALDGSLFTDGVPHTEFPGVPPIFPSWTLTCIGASSYYNHQTGVRGQHGFIGDVHLHMLDVYLDVDATLWARDMRYVESTIPAASALARVRRSRKMVKLFVGAEYECTRGHRQFLPAEGGAAALVENDLPLFMPCVFRKHPCENAQLMRIHIVTPKAPVTVTLNPKVVDPLSSGLFCTGEGPLQLSWSRYYILRLPFVYSSIYGVVPKPTEVGSSGVFKGHFLSVTYTPLASWM